MILLTRADFEKSIQSFINQSEKIETRWMLTNIPMLNYKYLQQTSYITITPPEDNQLLSVPSLKKISESKTIETIDNGVYEEEDPACAKFDQDNNQPTFIMSYHILYSSSYQVPVLYFNAQHMDGSTLSLDEIYEYIIPDIYQKELKTSPINIYGSVSQAVHPLNGAPFWYIHPCQTQNMLQSIGGIDNLSIDDYIKVWLSFVGPIVRYRIPYELFL